MAAVMAAAAAMSSGSVNAFAADDSVYVLMNIPYSVFYAADGVAAADVDAVSSATNKTGNYGKTGGAYHTGVTASVAEDGTVTAVGKDNGSKVRGVIWAVKADSIDDIIALGGEVVTDSSTVTVATLGHGATTSSTLVGYEALSEASDYSFYELAEAPDNYLELKNGKFTAGTSNSVSGSVDLGVSYGTRWGDIQIDAGEASDASDKLINAVVLTTDDGVKHGLYHLDQIWAFNQLAWKTDVLEGLDGKKITNIRYYCTVKDTDTTDGTAPEYVNYVYDYTSDLELSEVYTGEVTAKFKNENTLTISGLPEDAENVSVKVYYTTGGKNAEYTYITPLDAETAKPVFVSADDGVVAITTGSVTDSEGNTITFGEPVDGTEYTIEFSCDNYFIRKTATVYNASENTYDDSSSDASSDTDSSSVSDSSSSDTSSDDSSSATDTSSSSSSSSSSASSSSSSSASSASTSTKTTVSTAGGTNATATPNPNTGATGAAGAAVLLAASAVMIVRKNRNDK